MRLSRRLLILALALYAGAVLSLEAKARYFGVPGGCASPDRLMVGIAVLAAVVAAWLADRPDTEKLAAWVVQSGAAAKNALTGNVPPSPPTPPAGGAP
jgi:hypothetical protein